MSDVASGLLHVGKRRLRTLSPIFQRPPTAKILGIFATRSRHVLIAAVDRRVRQNVLLPL
jgi:hypothetical protein